MHRISISQVMSKNGKKLLNSTTEHLVEICVLDENYNPIFTGMMTRPGFTDALMGKTGVKMIVEGRDYE